MDAFQQDCGVKGFLDLIMHDVQEEKRGRPSIYTQEIADEICRRLASGQSLRRICRDENMPAEATVRYWAVNDEHDFFAQYARARDLGMDALAEETIDIADDGRNDTYLDADGNEKVDYDIVKRSQLRVSARQWYTERVAPKKYGQRQQVDMNANVNNKVEQLTPAEAAQALIEAAEADDQGGQE